MKIRADFDFKEETMGIKACKGYVIGEFTPTEEGGDFKPGDVILERLVAKSPDLKKSKLWQLQTVRCFMTITK